MLEKELADLISSGEVQARIDSHAKVLYARLTDARAAAYDNALKFGGFPTLLRPRISCPATWNWARLRFLAFWWEVFAVKDEIILHAYGKPAALADRFSYARSA